METLPAEIVEMIVQQLTPQDLARCSAVCRKWYEVFNRDWIWKPHCDPELEEPLQTVPCVTTPPFVAPEEEDSTLSSTSRWKLAFMRENHLWKNWRKKDINKKESIIKSENKQPISVEFLTDTLVVAQYSNHIEILDVTAMPPAFVTRTDIQAESFSVIGPNMFLAENICSVKVFNVDISNKTITLMHTIYLISPRRPRAVKEHFYLCVNIERTKLIVFDLYTGKLLKEEPFPVIMTQNGAVELWRILTSPTSEFVAVAFDVINDGIMYCKYYIYSLKQLAFLPDPVAGPAPVDARPHLLVASRAARLHGKDVALHDHWMVIKLFGTLKVYNLLSQEVFNLDLNCRSISECNNGFILWVYEGGQKWLKRYSPLHNTLTTICEIPQYSQFEVINKKIIAIFDIFGSSEFSKLWKTSGQMVECGPYVCFGSKINRSFTKVLNRHLARSGDGPRFVTYLW